MFSELMPLLAERTVLITVARESGTSIRATVVPKRTSESENGGLSTPLSFVGTPGDAGRTGPGLWVHPGRVPRSSPAPRQYTGAGQGGDGSRSQRCPGRGKAQGRRETEGKVCGLRVDSSAVYPARDFCQSRSRGGDYIESVRRDNDRIS